MFGRKTKEIARLTKENETLGKKVEAIELDPYYLLAQGLGAEIESIVSSRVNTDTRIDDAIERRRAALFLARINELAQAEIDRQTAEQKAQIEQQALVEANKLAADALQRFLTNDAAAYRHEVQQRLNAQRPETILREARQQIATEERHRLVEIATAQIRQSQAENAQRELLKLRAQELRADTRRTHIIRLEELQNGDPLTIAFTDQGQGFEPLTESDGYNSAYRSSLEARKVSGHLIDSQSGIFEVDKDSWLRQPGYTEHALRGGQQVYLLAEDPLYEHEDLTSCIVKGAPLTFQTLGGVALPDNQLDVWWTNLGDFRALS